MNKNKNTVRYFNLKLFNLRFRETVGRKVVKALKREDIGITYSAIEFLSALMQVNFHFPFFSISFVLY